MTQKSLDARAEEMAEFILPMIDSRDKTHDVIKLSGQNAHYLNTDVGMLLLLNRPYTENDYNILMKAAKKESADSVNVVFYKDLKEEMYFKSKLFMPKTDEYITRMQEELNENSVMYRPIMRQKKKEYNKESLRFYGPIEKERIIEPTKPEAERIRNMRRATYYQPKSSDEERKLLTYTFWDVVYDNRTNDPQAMTRPGRQFIKSDEKVAEDCNMWVECKEHNGILIPSFNIMKSTSDKIVAPNRPQHLKYAYLTNGNNL